MRNEDKERLNQQTQKKETLHPKWNEFSTSDTAFYQSESNNDSRAGKKYTGILILVLIIVKEVFV